MAGARPNELTLVRFGTTQRERVGTRLCLGWDETYAVGLIGANLQTRGQAARRKDFTELMATTQDAPGPKLEGAAAALIAAPTPEIDALLQRVAAACNLPRNEGGTGILPVNVHGLEGRATIPSKNLPIARQSYWFLSFGQNDVEKTLHEGCLRVRGLVSKLSVSLGVLKIVAGTLGVPSAIYGTRRVPATFPRQWPNASDCRSRFRIVNR